MIQFIITKDLLRESKAAIINAISILDTDDSPYTTGALIKLGELVNNMQRFMNDNGITQWGVDDEQGFPEPVLDFEDGYSICNEKGDENLDLDLDDDDKQIGTLLNEIQRIYIYPDHELSVEYPVSVLTLDDENNDHIVISASGFWYYIPEGWISYKWLPDESDFE